MDSLFHITTANGHFIYTLLYQISFLLAFILFLYIGVLKKYPLPTWLLLGTVGTIFFIIGTKVGTYSWEEWKLFFNDGRLVEVHSKSLIGGLVLGILSILLASRWLNFRPSLIDAYVIILPVVLILQRVGCLFAGCCFGTPTSMPWGVQYGSSFSIINYQQQEGILNSMADTSLAVHPVPLYLIGVYLLVLLAIWKTKNRWKYKGSLAFFGLSVLAGLRFFVEFLRAPATNHALGTVFLGLKEIQWVLLFLFLASTVVLILRERFGVLTISDISKTTKGLLAHAYLTTILLLIVWLGKDWFTAPETLIIHSYVLLILLALCFQVWKYRKQFQYKFNTLSMVILSFVLMSQTYDHDSIVVPYSTKNKTNTITVGARHGDFDLAFSEKKYSGEGCYRELLSTDSLTISSAFSGGIHFLGETKKSDSKTLVLGGGLTYSQYTRGSIYGTSEDKVSVGVNFYGGSDFNDHGYKVGVSMLNSFLTSQREISNVESREHSYIIFPILGFRVGNKNRFFAEGTLGDDTPYDLLYSRYKLGIGIGAPLLNLKNDSRLRFGIAENIDYAAFYLNGDIALGKHLILLPGARFGKYPIYEMGLSYKFKK